MSVCSRPSLRAKRLSTDEKALVSLLQRHAATFGGLVVDASDRVDVGLVIDRAATSPAMEEYFREQLEFLRTHPAVVARMRAEAARLPIRNPGQASPVGRRLDRLLVAIGQLSSLLPADVPAAVADVKIEPGALRRDLLESTEIAPAYAIGVAGMLAHLVCSLVSFDFEGRTVEPWRRQAVLEEWCAGLGRFVALLAAVDSTVVIDDELVPRADREAIRASLALWDLRRFAPGLAVPLPAILTDPPLR